MTITTRHLNNYKILSLLGSIHNLQLRTLEINYTLVLIMLNENSLNLTKNH